MIRCGFYERVITPPLGTDIPGGWCERPSTGVLDELYIRAFVTDDGEKRTALIVADAVELLNHQCDAIICRVEEMTGITADCVSVSGNHNHWAVPSGEPYGSKEDVPYMDVFCRVAADCVYLAQQRLQPCSLSFGVGRVEGISFNRDQVLSDGTVCTNAKKNLDVVRTWSDNDPELPVLFVRDETGKPLGALICFACHLCCVGGTKYSGDFSGEMARLLKETYGPEFVAIYTAGAAGDINHIDRMTQTRQNYLEMGAKLASETIRVVNEEAKPVSGDTVAGIRGLVRCGNRRATEEEVAEAKAIVESGQSDPSVMLGALSAILLLDHEEKMAANNQTEEDVPVQVSLVGDVFIVALPGEPYHQFGMAIKQGCPTGKCVISTLSHGMFGYIPMPELLGTSIYPAALCAGSRFAGDTGERIVNKVLQLMTELLRKDEEV
jgi:hypothetical protein